MTALRVSDEVRAATDRGGPVLALESTIFTHGLPRPMSLDVALEAEDRVRSLGVTPATIGVVDGSPTVGLSTAEIDRLANAAGVVKASLRDLPVAAVKGLSAGTTVAAAATWRTSRASACSPRAVSAGSTVVRSRRSTNRLTSPPLPRSPRGRERRSQVDPRHPADLGTARDAQPGGLGYRTTDYPGFYIADSGYDIEYAADSPTRSRRSPARADALGIVSTLLVANPVAAELELPPLLHDQILERALAAADLEGVSGHDTTPFLLDFMRRETGGRSLEVNVAVYRSNVRLGAEIALALAATS